MSSTATSASTQPAFSANADAAQLQQTLDPLLRAQGGKWLLTADGKGLERNFKFRGFKACWTFMNTVSAHCVEQKHHPEWSNVYDTCFIRWTTHTPEGLSEKDVSMAQLCDAEAASAGEVVQSVDEEKGVVGRQLADQAAHLGKGCCESKAK